MNREKIEECYKWDLSKIYSSINNIREDIKNVRNKLTEFSKYKDISYDENSLYEVINLSMEVSRIISKLEVYASLLCDEDTSINKNIELKEEINNLSSEVINATYFIEPNILKMNYSDIEKFYQENDKLKEYTLYIFNIYDFLSEALCFYRNLWGNALRKPLRTLPF